MKNSLLTTVKYFNAEYRNSKTITGFKLWITFYWELWHALKNTMSAVAAFLFRAVVQKLMDELSDCHGFPVLFMIYLTLLLLISPQVAFSLILHIPLTLFYWRRWFIFLLMKCDTTVLYFMFYSIKCDKLTYINSYFLRISIVVVKYGTSDENQRN